MFQGSSTVSVSQLRARFASQAVAAFDQMFGSDGQNGLVSFNDRERQACELGQQLAGALLSGHIGRDPAATAVEAECPTCGRRLRDESAGHAAGEVRRIETRAGPIEFRRTGFRCPACRKIFVPPG